MKLFDIFGFSIEANKKDDKKENPIYDEVNKYYCLWKSDLCDPFYINTKDKIFYGPVKNQNLDFNVYFNGFKNSPCLIKISKEKFDASYHNNICDCELGTGNNIVQSQLPYTEEEVCEILKTKYKDYYFEATTNCFTNISIDVYSSANLCAKPFAFIVRNNMYKKACLCCGKCLSDISEVYCEFEQIIMVNKICSK